MATDSRREGGETRIGMMATCKLCENALDTVDTVVDGERSEPARHAPPSPDELAALDTALEVAATSAPVHLGDFAQHGAPTLCAACDAELTDFEREWLPLLLASGSHQVVADAIETECRRLCSQATDLGREVERLDWARAAARSVVAMEDVAPFMGGATQDPRMEDVLHHASVRMRHHLGRCEATTTMKLWSLRFAYESVLHDARARVAVLQAALDVEHFDRVVSGKKTAELDALLVATERARAIGTCSAAYWSRPRRAVVLVTEYASSSEVRGNTLTPTHRDGWEWLIVTAATLLRLRSGELEVPEEFGVNWERLF
jgi:hypothetical protein